MADGDNSLASIRERLRALEIRMDSRDRADSKRDNRVNLGLGAIVATAIKQIFDYFTGR